MTVTVRDRHRHDVTALRADRLGFRWHSDRHGDRDCHHNDRQLVVGLRFPLGVEWRWVISSLI